MSNDDLERLELPELPDRTLITQMRGEHGEWIDVMGYTGAAMTKYARAAILADRQRRAQAAEPDGYLYRDAQYKTCFSKTRPTGSCDDGIREVWFTPTRAAPAEVTEEMVERACAGGSPVFKWPEDYAERERANIRKTMRMALEAALGGGDGR